MAKRKKSFFQAQLIMFRSKNDECTWVWMNAETDNPISDIFYTREAAENWFDFVMGVHNETYSLMERLQRGKFYTVKGKVDVGDVISSKKANDCPFDMDLEDDMLIINLLAVDEDQARKRVEEYFEILEWVE